MIMPWVIVQGEDYLVVFFQLKEKFIYDQNYHLQLF